MNIFKSGNNWRITGAWILLMTLFIMQLLVYTWTRVQCVQVGYEIAQETDTYQKLMGIQNTLKIELERLKSPQRIASIAQYQLGMITPTSQHIRMIAVHETH
ncbi:MAG: septum formation initiator family protein [Thermodesulfobacteriota bacterium]